MVFWKVEDDDQKAEDLDTEETKENARWRFLLRYCRVFNRNNAICGKPYSTRFQRLKLAAIALIFYVVICASVPGARTCPLSSGLSWRGTMTGALVKLRVG